ncbi:hypothetical protein [uncultured Arsenicicoccus sp.]|uniref:hypothetical protein n=1 Tax=uncultured Arsenicicoccus sp. TaxID=491339 RepID=UPI00259A2595|nr:hypothetical protein [uncultured Arsenicicoccus sp.]
MTSPHHDRPRSAGPPRLVGKSGPRPPSPFERVAAERDEAVARYAELAQKAMALSASIERLALELETVRVLIHGAHYQMRRGDNDAAAKSLNAIARHLN